MGVSSLKEMGMTLKHNSNQYAVLGALMQVEEVASISTAVLEQASIHVAGISFLRDHNHLQISMNALRSIGFKEGLVLR